MRPARLLLAAPVLALLTAAPASAVTLCVGDATCPADGFHKSSLADAAKSASAIMDPDTILLGAGTWTVPGGKLRLSGGDSLEGSGGPTVAAAVEVGARGRLAGVRIEIPAGQPVGLRASGAKLDGVAVEDTTGSTPDTVGMLVSGSSRIRGGSVALSAGTGVGTDGDVEVVDTTVEAPTGVEAHAAGASLRRVTISGWRGIVAPDGVVVDTALIRVRGNGGTGVEVGPAAGAPIPATVSHATILGDRSRGQRGVAVRSVCDASASASVTASALAGLSYPLVRHASCDSGPAQPPARLAVTRSAFDPANVIEAGPLDTPGSLIEAPVAATFTLDDDLAPAAGSPLVDAADPAEPAGVDLHLQARPVDGDGDGTAIADVGAVERRAAPPAPDCDGAGCGDGDGDHAGADDGSGAGDGSGTAGAGAGAPAGAAGAPTGATGGGAGAPSGAAGAQSGVAGQSDTGVAEVKGPRPRVRVARVPGRRRSFRVVVTVPRATAGTVDLATAAGQREFRVRTKRLGRAGRVAYRIELPRGVRRKRFGLCAMFRPADGGPARASRWTGLY